jgi:ABC-type transport system involved in multi-copper enzyme maturation permease subunit
MSEQAAAIAPAPLAAPSDRPAGTPGELRRRQLGAILRLELKKSFLGRRALWLYLLALLPVGVAALVAVVRIAFHRTGGSVSEGSLFFAILYQGFLLRVIIFIACVAIFGNLIRREMLDRSLHFYFLAPARRELVLLAKMLTGLVVAVILFTGTTLACFALAYLPFEPSDVSRFLLHGGGLGHLAAYLLVTALACLGYGALFLALGFLFKSPALPALAVFAWEGLVPFLPPFLKQLTVLHYLLGLCPFALNQGPFAILMAPPSPWVAVPGLLLLTAALLAFSAWRIRGLEISYEEY